MADEILSPSFSLKGWDWKIWLAKGVKELLKAVLPLITTWAATQDPVVSLIVGSIATLLLNIAEYFIKAKKA